MAINLQAVDDPRTDQNFRRIAGQFPAQVVANAVKELFLQLVTAGKVKINFGETTLTWTASAQSAVKEVEHGLGAKPVFVGLTLEAETGATVIGLRTTERSTSKMKIFGNASSSITATLTVMWVAIG